MRPSVQVVPAFRDEAPDAHLLAGTTECSSDEDGKARSTSISSPTSLPCSEDYTNGTPARTLVSSVAARRTDAEATDGGLSTEQLPHDMRTTMLEPRERTAAPAFPGSPLSPPLSSPGCPGAIRKPGCRIGEKALLEPIKTQPMQFSMKAPEESRTSTSGKGEPIREIPSRTQNPAEKNTGDAREFSKGGDRGSLESETTASRRHIRMKTLASLPGLMRPQWKSHAEEHGEDISAEINALSKVIAQLGNKRGLLLRQQRFGRIFWSY